MFWNWAEIQYVTDFVCVRCLFHLILEKNLHALMSYNSTGTSFSQKNGLEGDVLGSRP